MTISAKQVMALRAATGMPMMKCKKALENEGGDYEKAVERLRKEGLKASDARAERETGEGLIRISVSSDHRRGCLLALACESEPVSKTPMFTEFADRLMDQVVRSHPADSESLVTEPWIEDAGKTVGDALKEVQMRIAENMRVQDTVCLTADEDGFIGSYLHFTGKDGVLVALAGKPADDGLLGFAKNLGMHIVSSKPLVLRREDLSEQICQKEMEIARAQVEQDPKMAGKPPQVVDKIVKGKMAAFYKLTVLTEQPWVMDPDRTTVGDVLAQHGVRVTAFHRAHLGA